MPERTDPTPAPGPTQPGPTPSPNPTPAPGPTQPTPAPGVPAGYVPLDRLNAVTAEARAAQREREALQARIAELEDAQKSEVERAQSQAAREKAAREQAEQALATLRRDSLLRSVAAGANPVDVDAVVALLSSGTYGAVDVEKPETAAAALAKLREEKASLFGGGQTAPTSFGVPSTLPVGGPASPSNGPSDDPKLDAGRGLLTAILRSRGQA
jgi:hypothetical protein